MPMAKKTEPQNHPIDDFKGLWQQAMAQLGAGKNAAPIIAQLESALNGLHKMLGEASRLYDIACSANNAAGYRAAPAKGEQVSVRKKRLTQDERSRAIKQVAGEVAARYGGEVNVRLVADAIKERGIDLDTPVPGTMIGNVLNKSDAWKRLDRGIYKIVGGPG